MTDEMRAPTTYIQRSPRIRSQRREPRKTGVSTSAGSAAASPTRNALPPWSRMRRDTYLQVACSEIATISSPARNPRRIGDARTSRHSRRTAAGRTTSASATSASSIARGSAARRALARRTPPGTRTESATVIANTLNATGIAEPPTRSHASPAAIAVAAHPTDAHARNRPYELDRSPRDCSAIASLIGPHGIAPTSATDTAAVSTIGSDPATASQRPPTTATAADATSAPGRPRRPSASAPHIG